MCVMYVLTIYMPNCKSIGSKMAFISSKSFENVHMKNFQIRFFFYKKKYAIQKDENSTIELPVKFCIETMLSVVKMTALKFSPFFTGISQIHVLTFKLTLTSHLTYF